MDEFGVLTESFGLKPQGKSAPMASAKRNTSANNGQTWNVGMDSGFSSKPGSYSSGSSWNTNSGNGSFYRTNSDPKSQSYGGLDDYADISAGFQEPKQSDYDFTGSNNSDSQPHMDYVDDIFGGMAGGKVSVSVNNNDVFAPFASNPKKNGHMDDLLGNFNASPAKARSSSRNGDAAGFEDLIPGLGGSSLPKDGGNSKTNLPQQSTHLARSNINSSNDPFLILESSYASAYTFSDTMSDALEQLGKVNHSGGKKAGGSTNTSTFLRPPPKPAQVVTADKGASSIDEFEEFARSKPQNKVGNRKEGISGFPRPAATTQTDKINFQRGRHGAKDGKHKEVANATQTNQQKDPMFDAWNTGASKGGQVASSRSPPHGRTSFGVDDLSSMFGAASVFEEFQEVEGESEERRRARLGRQQRTQQRAAKAVADMNQRDLQTQQEQEERLMIAVTVDVEIKRWSAGKEGNMRALLSSLQHVLWTECGWDPVSLTDLITSASVKKVYRKATLCVHPDKVQQKGANLQQRYTAEKVFDVLKEAWKKFSKEELS